MNLLSPVFIDITQLVEATTVLLREQSACQLVESDSEADDDDTEHDEVLMDAVSDLLPAFAKAMGSHFAPIFSTLFNSLMKFAVSFGCSPIQYFFGHRPSNSHLMFFLSFALEISFSRSV